MMTDHYSIEQWADYGRGRAPSEERARMQNHLAEGCKRCSEAVALWNGVLQTAAADSAFEPPADILRTAQALYATLRPLGAATLRVARLSWFGQMAMEGVRSATAVPSQQPVHYLYKEGTLLLDIHVAPQADRVAVTGQLVDSSNSARRFDNRSISVMRKRDALARTQTNGSGEFSLEYAPGEELVLLVELENNSYLVSNLPA